MITKNSVVAVIPARWGSSRFPGKPLHLIAGKSLIQRVWENATKCQLLDNIIIATDDDRIREHAIGFGAEVAMTATSHNSGTDRIMEVVTQKQLTANTRVLNIQGDEPELSPHLLQQMVLHLQQQCEHHMLTAITVIADEAKIVSPHVVKCVINQQQQAMYFSRSPIPYRREISEKYKKYYAHKGIYGYSVHFLQQFTSWQPSNLELIESLEQLRALDNGAIINTIITDDCSEGIDTIEQANSYQNKILTSL